MQTSKADGTGSYTGTPVALGMGANTIPVGSADFYRQVNLIVEPSDVEISSLTLNGVEQLVIPDEVVPFDGTLGTVPGMQAADNGWRSMPIFSNFDDAGSVTNTDGLETVLSGSLGDVTVEFNVTSVIADDTLKARITKTVKNESWFSPGAAGQTTIQQGLNSATAAAVTWTDYANAGRKIKFQVSEGAGDVVVDYMKVTVGTTEVILFGTAPEIADTTDPTITLIGDNPLNLTVGAAFSDPGASASDNVDGVISDITVSGAGDVDTSVAGSYTVTYSATDAAGNTATATRTVVVSELASGSINFSELPDAATTTNATWKYKYEVFPDKTNASSLNAQDYVMQVDSLPSSGASWRLFYTTAGGAGTAGAGKELVVGTNTISLPALTLNETAIANGDIGRKSIIQVTSGAFSLTGFEVNGTLIHGTIPDDSGTGDGDGSGDGDGTGDGALQHSCYST